MRKFKVLTGLAGALIVCALQSAPAVAKKGLDDVKSESPPSGRDETVDGRGRHGSGDRSGSGSSGSGSSNSSGGSSGVSGHGSGNDLASDVRQSSSISGKLRNAKDELDRF